jgi:hypothetical protein
VLPEVLLRCHMVSIICRIFTNKRATLNNNSGNVRTQQKADPERSAFERNKVPDT